MRTYRTLFLVVAFIQSSLVFGQLAGQECFPTQDKDKLVYDEAQIFSAAEFNELENKLEQFAVSTSNEIFVVVVPDLCGMDKAQFATELGEKWGAGQAKEDNGIIILVKPKTADEKGQVFIATGRGLEGAVPDAEAHLIVDNEMIPEFREGNMYAGIDKAVTVIMELAKGEYSMDTYAAQYQKKNRTTSSVVVFVICIILFFFFIKTMQVRRYSRTNNMGFWAAWALLNSINNRHSGSWRDFSGGRGTFGGWGGGGSSGGGFGGFGGGGSFGGGGAGGSW
jgi:uncharacterized protein